MRRLGSCGSFWGHWGMHNSNWKTASIASVCNVKRGASPRPIDDPRFFSTEGRGWVRISDVTSTYKTLDRTEQYLSPRGVVSSVSVEPGQLIMSICATIGKPVIAGIQCCIHDGFVLFDQLSDEVDPEFLFFQLLKNEAAIRRNRQIGTQGNLNTSLVKAIGLELPPLVEQKKIAQILDTLDTQIRQTEALIAKLERIKQGLLTDLLTRGIDENGQLRPTPDQAPHLYKDSPLGRIPKEWNTVTVDSISEMVTSGARDWARFYTENGARFIRIGNLTREHINFRFDSLVHVSPPTGGEGQRTSLEPGDVLLSITADLGITAVVDETMGEAYINQHIALIRPDQTKINARFLGHFIASGTCQKFISALNDAGAKAGLNLPTVRNILVVQPEHNEQDEIQQRLDAIDRRIRETKSEAKKLTLEKTGLMDDLLTGRVRVTPLLSNAISSDQTTETHHGL